MWRCKFGAYVGGPAADAGLTADVKFDVDAEAYVCDVCARVMRSTDNFPFRAT